MNHFCGAGVVGPPPCWTYCEWGSVISNGYKDDKGKYIGRKLTFLESVPVLATMVTMPTLVQGHQVVFHVDNAGTVSAFQKGHSRDPLTQTIIRATHLVMASLNSSVEVVKVKRCSDRGSVLSDLLS